VNVKVHDEPLSCLHDDPYIHYLLNEKESRSLHNACHYALFGEYNVVMRFRMC
jgi:hypothetical protein